MYQCHTFIYRILMVCVYLVRSSTEFTSLLSPFLHTEVFSFCGTNLADVGGIDWYPVANIKHGWIEETLGGIIRNLLTDIHDVRVVQSEARWRLVASEKLFVATRDGFWGDQRSSWSDHLNFVLNNRSIILVQLISHYFTIDVTWWFEKKYELKRAATKTVLTFQPSDLTTSFPGSFVFPQEVVVEDRSLLREDERP